MRTQTVELNNESYDLAIKMKAALGQVLRIQDIDTGSSLLELSNSSLNVLDKQIKGVANGVAGTDCVTVQ